MIDMRNECNIIQDILPLYIENMVSQDTISFVEEHLSICTECQKKLEHMKTANDFGKIYEKSFTKSENDIIPLKVLKRKMRF